MELPHWYKWVILCTACLSTFTGMGYITGSTSIVTIFYIQQYEERIISAIIAPVQTGSMQVSALPALYIGKKTGNLVLQVIGSLLMSVAVALTAFTVSSWQGLLLSGVCAGFGGGMVQVATTNIIKQYFPGRQIGPFGAISLTMNVAGMAVPQLWSYLMGTLGWFKTLFTVGGILLINLCCGLSYFQPQNKQIENDEQVEKKPRLSLVPRHSSSQLFIVDLEQEMTKKTSLDLKLENSIDDEDHISNSSDDSSTGSEKMAANDTETTKNSSMWKTMKQPQSIALIVMSGLYSGGLTGCFTVMGDYAVRFLNMSDEQVANALTVQGALQIVASLIYIFLTVCTEHSSVLLHAICMFGLSASVLSMSFISSEASFLVLVGAIGFFKAFTSGNSVPLAIELVGPENAMNLYVMMFLCDGFGSAGMPFLAVYLQETIDERAALYFGAAALAISGAIFIPFIQRYLFKPRLRSPQEKSDYPVTINAIFN